MTIERKATARRQRGREQRSGDNLNGDSSDNVLEKIGLTKMVGETTAELLGEDISGE